MAPKPTLADKLDEVYDELKNPHAKALMLVTLGVTLKQDEILARGLGITVSELQQARADLSHGVKTWNAAQSAVQKIVL